MYEDEDSKDIHVKVVQCDGAVMEVRIHSFLLRQSEYFDALLVHPFREHGKTMIEVKDVEHAPFKQIVLHLYALNLTLSGEIAAWQLLQAGQYFQLPSLVSLCEQKLLEFAFGSLALPLDSKQCLPHICNAGGRYRPVDVTRCVDIIARSIHLNARRVQQEALWMLQAAEPADLMLVLQDAPTDILQAIAQLDQQLIPETDLCRLLLRPGGTAACELACYIRLAEVDDAVLVDLLKLAEKEQHTSALVELCHAWACKSGAQNTRALGAPRPQPELLCFQWQPWREPTYAEVAEMDVGPGRMFVAEGTLEPQETADLDGDNGWLALGEPSLKENKLYVWTFRMEHARNTPVPLRSLQGEYAGAESGKITIDIEPVTFLANGHPVHNGYKASGISGVEVSIGDKLRVVVDTKLGRLQLGEMTANFDVSGGGPWALSIASATMDSDLEGRDWCGWDCRVVTVNSNMPIPKPPQQRVSQGENITTV